MPLQTELWLVRHGETEWSLSGAHTSRSDIPLTDRGRERAKSLQRLLQAETFVAVLSSPMQRAQETCRIAGFADQMQLEPDLREWDYGIYEGKTTPEIRETDPNWSVWTNPIRGGESVDQVGARADAVIQKALSIATEADPSSTGPSKVALFAHAHILRILAARWAGLDAVEGRILALGTGSVSVLGWERETRVIERWNRGVEDERCQSFASVRSGPARSG